LSISDGAGNVTGTETIRPRAAPFATLEEQVIWNLGKQWSFNASVLNLFNRGRSFVVSVSGTNRGQQFGCDDRYCDPRGCTLYVNASYKF